MVPLEQIEEIRSVPVVSHPFKGTQSVHQITLRKDNPLSLQFNRLSCFRCRPGQTCSHYHIGTLNYPVPNVTNEVEADQPATNDNVPPATSLSAGSWVVVYLSGDLSPGMH